MSSPHKKYQTIPKEEAQKLLDAIEGQLNNRFTEIRTEKYNPNTKGYDYEARARKVGFRQAFWA